jgi:hypothetical protein
LAISGPYKSSLCYYSAQKEGKIRRNSVGISLDGDHLSPGSVLEASFSNDSCFSSSLDDSSGKKVEFYDNAE